jgi:hypothetical protein
MRMDDLTRTAGILVSVAVMAAHKLGPLDRLASTPGGINRLASVSRASQAASKNLQNFRTREKTTNEHRDNN